MNVGKLTRVPLRDVWKHEATGFTRWLEDNIAILYEVIDLTLAGSEREKREKSAGEKGGIYDMRGRLRRGGALGAAFLGRANPHP